VLVKPSNRFNSVQNRDDMWSTLPLRKNFKPRLFFILLCMYIC
jgi:hypothetical protein